MGRMGLTEYLKEAVKLEGSDIFIIPGSVVTVKVKGKLTPLSEQRLKPADTEQLVREMYEMSGRNMDLLYDNGDDDFSFAKA